MERMMKKSSYELLGQDPKWVKKLLFAGVFIQENKLHAIFDRYNEMTSKQWLLMATMTSFTDAPDLSMLAKVMGCSRQNVKKLALSLEKQGYVILEKSPKDARSLCVVMSKQGLRFRKDMEGEECPMQMIIEQMRYIKLYLVNLVMKKSLSIISYQLN